MEKEQLYYALNDILDTLEYRDKRSAIYMLEDLINKVRNS